MKMYSISIQEANGGTTPKNISIEKVLVVGYGGRNVEKVHEHIHELSLIGVDPPSTIPALYPQPLSGLTTESTIIVQGTETSGEVEYVLFHDGEEWLVTVGSDHTDRHLETEDIQKSKEACPKPFVTQFWRLVDVQDHWDQLILRSWMTDKNGTRLYQEHNLTALLPVSDLLGKLKEFGYEDLKNTIIFSGTVPTLGGFVYGNQFIYEMRDPVLNRTLNGEYSVVVGG
ncbi:DUF2848 family protein [Effusibacillus dendaii]|uniref:DUF2848 domain-containing protein n=1 Tax=Effusibacillus dendaii TaxID=2743772 RepID=A0A7I8D9Y2_9BACL|nr:DUF2848 family protein [Effusibacillus dendaii]BCJ86924.1 hypothetical protein skT53_19090 [Effusibacillus dendaii]